jgi:leucyl/phenylalanyl-tRNA--protein transferase
VISSEGYVSSIDFPDPRQAMAEGLIAVGGRLDVGTLFHAYRRGIFPWPQEGYPMLWFSPEQRGVLFFDELHVPRRWRGLERPPAGTRFSRDEAFREVVEACRGQKRPGQQGTWITPEIVEAYVRFFEAGFARSYELWRDGRLVGGLYGVMVDGVFSGESMFHREDDASKRVLLHAIHALRDEGLTWMDTQMVTPVVAAFGGRTLARDEYLTLLRRSQRRPLPGHP